MNTGPELLAFLGDSSTSIVSAFDALAKLKPSTAQSRATPLAFLIPTATRALETLGSLVVSVLPGASAASSLPASQVLKDASGLLRHVLTTAVPLMVLKVQSQLKSSSRSGKLSAEVALDDFLSLLASVLLVPLIRAFKPLSRLYLAAVFDGTLCDTGYTGSAAGADVRTYVAIVLRQAASTLGMLCASADTDPATGVLQRCARSTVERLALEAVRELEALSVHDDAPLRQPSSDDTLQRERRVWRLADKDAQCFLCASLHTFFDMSVFSSSSYPNPKRPGEPSLSDPSTAEDAHLLRDGMLTSLSALLRRRSQPWTHLDSQNTADDSSKDNGGREDDGCGGKQVHLEAGKITDQVGHGMILSVIEKAWLSGFVDGTLILDSRGI
ncbi:hypothetical protein PLICRDRAFT_44121 [Plicaturopsis crispa FD-325 SS-3]|nr:hypothetical protein PLICRDRAFT_44121 [Plicaturopsis crispa FD-325 SS-3]